MKKDKITILMQNPQKIFHTSDLMVLWNFSNKNTLYTSISRLVKKKVLIKVQKGLYSKVPLDQLDQIEVGFRAINRFNYLSTETVLSKNGIINQSPSKITFISSFSTNFNINKVDYLIRQLKSQFLHNTLGISQSSNGILTADTERAVADMLYFQPKYHFDANNLINWDLVKNYQKQIYL